MRAHIFFIVQKNFLPIQKHDFLTVASLFQIFIKTILWFKDLTFWAKICRCDFTIGANILTVFPDLKIYTEHTRFTFLVFNATLVGIFWVQKRLLKIYAYILSFILCYQDAFLKVFFVKNLKKWRLIGLKESIYGRFGIGTLSGGQTVVMGQKQDVYIPITSAEENVLIPTPLIF